MSTQLFLTIPFSSVKVLELATYIADWIDRILDTFRIRGPGRIATETWNDLKPQRYTAHSVFRIVRTLIRHCVPRDIVVEIFEWAKSRLVCTNCAQNPDLIAD